MSHGFFIQHLQDPKPLNPHFLTTRMVSLSFFIYNHTYVLYIHFLRCRGQEKWKVLSQNCDLTWFPRPKQHIRNQYAKRNRWKQDDVCRIPDIYISKWKSGRDLISVYASPVSTTWVFSLKHCHYYCIYVHVHKGVHLSLVLHMALFALACAYVLNWQRSVWANEKTKWPPIFPALLSAPAAVYSFCLHVKPHISIRTNNSETYRCMWNDFFFSFFLRISKE